MHVLTMLERWLPGASISLTVATSGVSTPVWRVAATWPHDRSEAFFLRLGEEPGEIRDGEVSIHQRLRARGVRVPDVVTWESLPPELDRAATLTRAMPGEPMSALAAALPPEAVTSAARAAGRDLARIGEEPVRGFGWTGFIRPNDQNGMLHAEYATRNAWLAEYDQSLDTVLSKGLIPSANVPLLQMAFTAWRDSTSESSDTATLAHGDFDATHIFCARDNATAAWTYSGIIDFGEARGADPFYDLGHALLHDNEGGNPSIFAALLAGYCEIRPVSRLDLDAITHQAVAIGVRHLAIAHRRGSRYTKVLISRLTQLLGTQFADDGGEIRS
ncbi:MAG: aminoglycoside phosphotransferase family protein [Thermomicrobiales bacterium]